MTIGECSNLNEGREYLFQSFINDPSNLSRVFNSGYLLTEESAFGTSYMNEINHTLEYLNGYIDLHVYKTFNLQCTWRYKWVLFSGSRDFETEWVMFDVIEGIPSVEIVSESIYNTRADP